MSKSKGTRTALIALAVAEICLTTGCKRGIQSTTTENVVTYDTVIDVDNPEAGCYIDCGNPQLVSAPLVR